MTIVELDPDETSVGSQKSRALWTEWERRLARCDVDDARRFQAGYALGLEMQREGLIDARGQPNFNVK